MMLFSSLSSLTTIPRLIPSTYKPPPPQPGNAVERILRVGRRETSRRGISVVTRAAPSATSYLFAFAFPLTLLAVTIFTSIRIVDKLDQKYMEELAVNQAILEAEEDDDEFSISPDEEEPTPIRTRNRPKRQVEPSDIGNSGSA